MNKNETKIEKRNAALRGTAAAAKPMQSDEQSLTLVMTYIFGPSSAYATPILAPPPPATHTTLVTFGCFVLVCLRIYEKGIIWAFDPPVSHLSVLCVRKQSVNTGKPPTPSSGKKERTKKKTRKKNYPPLQSLPRPANLAILIKCLSVHATN